MLAPAIGPFLFDTSAESWFRRNQSPEISEWLVAYLAKHAIHASAITVFERVRGYALLWRKAAPDFQAEIELDRLTYLREPGKIWPVNTTVAAIAAEISALLPQPPTPPMRSHRHAEPRQERLARWRADTIIAAMALAADMLLLHNNAVDFEAIRGVIEREPSRFPKLGPLRLMRCTLVL